MPQEFRLADFVVHPSLVRLTRGEETIRVRARVMDVLVYLAQHPGEVVSKDALFRDVWRTDAVSESALTRTIAELREALGDDAERPSILETIPKRGYRLLVPAVWPPTDVTTTEAAGISSDKGSDGRRSALAIMAVIGTVVVAGTATGYFVRARPPATKALVTAARLTISPPSGVAVAELAAPTSLAISPDGQWIAFVGTSAKGAILYLRHITEIEPRRVGPAGSPFFSPDSQWLGFVQNDAIQKLPVRGEHPQKICTVGPHGIRGASWGDDGTIVFSSGEGVGLRRVPADGGTHVSVTAAPPGGLHYFPDVLPGSTAALFTIIQGVSESRRSIAVVQIATGEVRPLVMGTAPRFIPPETIAFRRGSSLYAARFDAANLRLLGEPRLVLDDVNYFPGSGSSAFGVSASGSLVYIPGGPETVESELAWLRRDGSTESISPGRRIYSQPSLDPEQRRIAVHLGQRDTADVWVYDMTAQTWSRLTTGLETSGPIRWSADGRWVFFSSSRSGYYKLFRIEATGGEAEGLTDGFEWDYVGDVHWPFVVFQRQVRPSVHDLMTLQLGPQRRLSKFLSLGVQEGRPGFSPDGRWVAYDSYESGHDEIFVRGFPAGEPRIRIANSSVAFGPRWSHDGRTLYYRRSQEIWAAAVQTGSQPVFGTPELVLQSELLSPQFWQDGIQVSPDGQRFLIAKRPTRERKERLLVYLPQWYDEVHRALGSGK